MAMLFRLKNRVKSFYIASTEALPKQNFRALRFLRDKRDRLESCVFDDRWSFQLSPF